MFKKLFSKGDKPPVPPEEQKMTDQNIEKQPDLAEAVEKKLEESIIPDLTRAFIDDRSYFTDADSGERMGSKPENTWEFRKFEGGYSHKVPDGVIFAAEILMMEDEIYASHSIVNFRLENDRVTAEGVVHPGRHYESQEIVPEKIMSTIDDLVKAINLEIEQGTISK